MEYSNEIISIFWFRRDLRLDDNCGLYNSLQGNYPVLPIFIFDKHILDNLEYPHDRRVSFIHQQIIAIHHALLKKSSGIIVEYGDPEEVFERLTKKYKIDAVFANHDYEPYSRERDKKVEKLLRYHGISFLTFKDHVIFEKDEILSGTGEPYKVFTPYKTSWINKLNSDHPSYFPSEQTAFNFLRTPSSSLPSLTDLGFIKSNQKFPRLKLDEAIVKSYSKTRDFPSMETSRIGIHLRFGTLSVRKAVDFAKQCSRVWLEELIWREFFMMILFHHPHVVEKSYKKKYDNILWRNNEAEFHKWCEGKTGYPIVDAGMRELKSSGFMHNRVRMITASFLTKHLLIDWRWGEAYFAKHLLDYELSSNNGNWQWAAGTGADAQPYFRVFNPILQFEKFDKNMHYTKKWVPELGTAGYPKPMVIHKEARERALTVYQKALN